MSDIADEWTANRRKGSEPAGKHHEYPALQTAYPYVGVFLSVPPCRDHPCTCGRKIVAEMRRRGLQADMIQDPPRQTERTVRDQTREYAQTHSTYLQG